jgi:hypothetical protein
VKNPIQNINIILNPPSTSNVIKYADSYNNCPFPNFTKSTINLPKQYISVGSSINCNITTNDDILYQNGIFDTIKVIHILCVTVPKFQRFLWDKKCEIVTGTDVFTIASYVIEVFAYP